MLKEKNSNQYLINKESNEEIEQPEEVQGNPIVDIYNAIKKIIHNLHEDPNNDDSPLLFKTIAIDNGQFSRIIRDENLEFEIAFPAIFIHFINIRYLVQQQRIGEGRATMRIRFILNNLNNSAPEHECDPFIVFQRLNMAIQDAKDHEPALNERCNLTYFDMPTTVNYLQAYWIDYEVWFRESSAWKYRKWLKKHLVIPPFTNHSDALEFDTEKHGNHEVKHDQCSGFSTQVDEPNDSE